MNRTGIGLALILLGVAVVALSALAHVIGLSLTGSDSAPDTFGTKQLVGVIVGALVVAAGIYLMVSGRRTDSARDASR